jgi:hypothetical protein
MRTLTLLACGLLFAPRLLANGDKPDAGVSFHLETEPGGNPKMVLEQLVAGERRFFHRAPEISTNDVTAFNPFPSEDPNSYGVVLTLSRRGANRLAAITTANQGRWLLATVGGRVVDAVLIDQPVDDGTLVIWKGITLPEIKQFDKNRPRIGEKGRKKPKDDS